MGLTRKVPSEMVDRTDKEQGAGDGPNRFASARFELKLPRKPPAPPPGDDETSDAGGDRDPAGE